MTGPRLRLVREDANTAAAAVLRGDRRFATTPDGARVLKFPGAVRDVVGGPDPRRMAPEDVARLAMRSLDAMQSQLDSLKREADQACGATAPCGSIDGSDDPGHRAA